MAGLNVLDLLRQAVDEGVSDIFITAGSPILFKKDGFITPINDQKTMPGATAQLLEDVFSLARNDSFQQFKEIGDYDFSVSVSGLGRFRVSAFRQRSSIAAVIRVMRPSLPDYVALNIPQNVIDLYRKTHGLILVTGPAGSGKSTTLASIIAQINERRNGHILTLEDPIEYLHAHNKSIVNQREVGTDTASYARALRAALRQSPDVILVGEMRDLETTSIALTAAETGTLVLSTMHTIGAAKSIDRIVDVFPPSQQQQVRIQLSAVLQAVVSQQLLPSPSKGRVPVFEILMSNPAICNMIRDAKTHQIDSAIHSGGAQGMQLMDYAIAGALQNGDITREVAMTHAVNPGGLEKYMIGK